MEHVERALELIERIAHVRGQALARQDRVRMPVKEEEKVQVARVAQHADRHGEIVENSIRHEAPGVEATYASFSGQKREGTPLRGYALRCGCRLKRGRGTGLWSGGLPRERHEFLKLKVAAQRGQDLLPRHPIGIAESVRDGLANPPERLIALPAVRRDEAVGELAGRRV